MASLSPWVPCPDVVARRMLDVAKAGSTTRHYDLGCGDGRLNFHALDTYAVRHTTGIDIDPNLIRRAEERLSRRHPRPANVDFVTADLLEAPELWKQMGSDADTVITCYFVEEALQKIQPLLEEHCGSKGIRVVTCGYEMKGWHAKWSEVVLGLPIFLYELKDDEEAPPTIEELKAAMSMADSNEVIEAAARAAEIDDGGGRAGLPRISTGNQRRSIICMIPTREWMVIGMILTRPMRTCGSRKRRRPGRQKRPRRMRMDKRRVLASETQLIKWLHEFQAGCFMARNLHKRFSNCHAYIHINV